MGWNGQKIINPEAGNRRREAWDMRLRGASVAEIAAHFGVSTKMIYLDLDRTVKMLDVTKWLEQELTVDLQRLDKLFHAFWPQALQADIDAANLCLKIMDKRARLLGLDAPKRVDVRLLVEQWAERQGLDPVEVAGVVNDLLPLGPG